MMKALSRILSISRKEIRQIRRDIRSLLIIFVLPVSLLVLFGYAISLDVNNVRLAVYDKDRSALSRDFISSFTGSGYFTIVKYISGENEVSVALDKGTVQCVMVIPPDFSKDIESGNVASIQFLIDGVDASTATIILNYVNMNTRSYSAKIQNEFLNSKGISLHLPVNAEPQFWYNKDLNTTQYFIPGLIAMILIIISVILTSISLVREKELGTIELIRVSPVSSFQLIIGKIIPYLIVSLIIAASILFMGNILFGITVKGSYFYLFLGTLCYLFSTLSLGVLISTIADSQQVAFQMSQLISQLPTVILSGFVFPIESMPFAIQILSNITPAKFYIEILRDVLIKGAGMEAYRNDMIYLLIFAVIFIGISVIRTRRERIS